MGSVFCYTPWLKTIKFHCRRYYLGNMTHFQKKLLLHQGMKDLMHSLVLWDKMMIIKAQTFSMWQSSYIHGSYSLKYLRTIIVINTPQSIKYYLCCFEKDWYKVIYTYHKTYLQRNRLLHFTNLRFMYLKFGGSEFFGGKSNNGTCKNSFLKRGLLTTCDLGQY